MVRGKRKLVKQNDLGEKSLERKGEGKHIFREKKNRVGINVNKWFYKNNFLKV